VVGERSTPSCTSSSLCRMGEIGQGTDGVGDCDINIASTKQSICVSSTIGNGFELESIMNTLDFRCKGLIHKTVLHHHRNPFECHAHNGNSVECPTAPRDILYE